MMPIVTLAPSPVTLSPGGEEGRVRGKQRTCLAKILFALLFVSASGLLSPGLVVGADPVTFFADHVDPVRIRRGHSTHFHFVFNPLETAEAYVERAAGYLEASFEILTGQMGYPVPQDLREDRIEIRIDSVLPMPDTVGYAQPGYGAVPPHIGLLNNLDEQWLKGTSAHELFHIVQFDYDQREANWLKEATAKWIEDEVFPPAEGEGRSQVGYPIFMDSWYRKWGVERLPLDTFQHTGRGKFQYGTGIFFKYLTEHLPGGPALIRSIWEKAGSFEGNNALRAISEALGDDGLTNTRFQERFIDFATAVLIKDRPPYDFRRRSEITEDILQFSEVEIHMENSHVKKFHADLGKVIPFEDEIRPLTARYYVVDLPRDMELPASLYLSIKTKNAASPLRFALAKYSTQFPEGIEAEVLGQADAEGVLFRKIDGVKGDFDKIYRVALIAAHTDFSYRAYPEKLAIRLSMAEPAHLVAIQLRREKGEEVFYQARWEEGEPKRNLNILKDLLVLEDGENEEIGGVSAEVVFSRELRSWKKIELEMAGQSLGVPVLEQGYAYRGGRVEGKGSFTIREEDWEAGGIRIEVNAVDFSARKIDGNPATPVKIIEKDLTWENYEATRLGPDLNAGGKDDNCWIRLEEKPPRVKQVEVRSGKNVYYRGSWRETRGPAKWELPKDRIVREELKLAKVDGAEVEIEFTSRVREARAFIGGIPVSLSKVEEGKIWRGPLPIGALKNKRREGLAPLEIEARGRLRQPLDADPATVPEYDREGKKWTNYEPGQDAWHELWLTFEPPPGVRGMVVERINERIAGPAPGAWVIGGVGYYQVDKELFERYHELTSRMMGVHRKMREAMQRKTTYEPTRTELEAYDQFEKLKPEIRQKAKYFGGGDPAWTAVSDENGIFEIPGMPYPGKDGVIYAFYDFYAFKEGHYPSDFPGGSTGALFGDYHDVQGFREELLGFQADMKGYQEKLDREIQLKEQWGVRTVLKIAPRKGILYGRGQPISGNRLLPPLRSGKTVETFLFKQAVDSDETAYKITREITAPDDKYREIGFEWAPSLTGFLPVYLHTGTSSERYPGRAWPGATKFRFGHSHWHRDFYSAGTLAGKDFWDWAWAKYSKPLAALDPSELKKRREETQRIINEARARVGLGPIPLENLPAGKVFDMAGKPTKETVAPVPTPNPTDESAPKPLEPAAPSPGTESGGRVIASTRDSVTGEISQILQRADGSYVSVKRDRSGNVISEKVYGTLTGPGAPGTGTGSSIKIRPDGSVDASASLPRASAFDPQTGITTTSQGLPDRSRLVTQMDRNGNVISQEIRK